MNDDLAGALCPIDFARDRLGFHPDAKQQEILTIGKERLILNTTRQFGKSTVAAVEAVHRAYYSENCTVLVASPTLRQSSELIRKAAGFLRLLGIRPRGDGTHEVSLVMPNGSRIIGLPGTEATTRGYSAVSLLIVDEAAQVTDEAYQAVLPSLAVSNGDLWVMSTPLGKSGFFYDLWTKGGPKWNRVMVPASDVPRISREFLDEQKALSEPMFRREYCCEFVEPDGALYDAERLEEMLAGDVAELQWEF